MKKIITFTILICLIFGACAKKEPNQDTDLFKDFELDLSEMHLDFTKPQVLKYNSEFQRDSIINSLAQEFTEIAQESVTANDSALNKVLISVLQEPKTITIQLKTAQELPFSDWNDLGVFGNADSLATKMKTYSAQNELTELGMEYDLKTFNISLYSKK
ncbi:hypothetical protein [Flavobacterium sp.]|jgi:hypothetical protein|uniref:hypothetical protein n=1 Tax=Flavobacterium sp. TaxID=239 RepID=UPI0037C063E2